MLSQYSVLGFIDLGGERRRAAPIRMHLLDKPPMRVANRLGAGPRLKPQNLIGFLRAHTARTRRRALALSLVSVSVVPPAGVGTVEVTLQKP